MNLFKDFERRIRQTLRELDLGELPDELFQKISAEPPRDPGHGDVATNAAMVLAKPLQMRPRDLASRIVAALEADSDIESIEIAGPGFINLRLRPAVWSRILAQLLAEGPAWGRSAMGAGQLVNVEYVSANPTGPMHVGHCRGAVLGDALANILEATGHDVTREYYINDAGAQVDALARSVFLRYLEHLGDPVSAIPAGLYPGDYLIPVGEALAHEFGDRLREVSEDEWLPIVRDRAIDAMMAVIREDLATLGVQHDRFFSERTLSTNENDRVAEMIGELSDRGLVYQGRLPRPKGQKSEDWEDREQTLFRSSGFGDDSDRALLKSDGSYTYFASDIAYHFDKHRRGFHHMIDVLGADHGGYAKRMKAAVEAFSDGRSHLEVLFCQIVRLFRGGAPVVMSKRSGELVTLRAVVDEVGRDAVRFMMLYRKADAPLDFDFQVVTEQSKDNPVFYVQYAHARTSSVRRQAGEEVPNLDIESRALSNARLELLTDDGEAALVKALADWPRILDAAARMREPHRIAYYLYDLASAFHAHWNRGKELPYLRFIQKGETELTSARLGLVTAVGFVLKAGLTVLGVEAPDEMR